MKRVVSFAACILFMASCSGQEHADNPQAAISGGVSGSAEINWMSFEDAVALSSKAPKKLFIDVYTHWCGWCKKMDKSTFLDPEVVAEISQNYYAVKLDAERKDTVAFRDKEFVYKPEYKSHELAIALMNGKMSYPTYVFLDENFSIITPVQGYKTVAELMPMLRYISGDVYKSKSWDEYLAGLTAPAK